MSGRKIICRVTEIHSDETANSIMVTYVCAKRLAGGHGQNVDASTRDRQPTSHARRRQSHVRRQNRCQHVGEVEADQDISSRTVRSAAVKRLNDRRGRRRAGSVDRLTVVQTTIVVIVFCFSFFNEKPVFMFLTFECFYFSCNIYM